MTDGDAVKKAKMRAMYLLQVRNRSEKALTEKLQENGFEEEAIRQALEYVKSFGYLDDFRYAQSYILQQMEKESKNRILAKLYQRGISRETAEEAWEEVCGFQSPQERELIRRFIQKKCRTETELSVKEYRRLCGGLARRGFQFEEIRAVMEEEKIHIKS